MTFEDLFDLDDIEDNKDLRPGPLWRHALWPAAVTALGVGLGWVGASSSIGSEGFGLPASEPGPVWGYLAAWSVIGLLAAGVLRATAARVLVHIPGQIAAVLILVGTRLTLGWRPEPPLLAAMAVVPPVVAALWCVVALREAAKPARRRAARSARRDDGDGAAAAQPR